MLENDYYFSKTSLAKRPDNLWHGTVSFYRKDSSEFVTSTNLRHKDKKFIPDRLKQLAAERLVQLGKPDDWMSRSKVDMLYTYYLNHKQRSIDIRLYIYDFRSVLSEKDLGKCLQDLVFEINQAAIHICNSIHEMSESELCDLVGFNQQWYDNLDQNELWFDDVSAKRQLYRYIKNPSKPVQAAHQRVLDVRKTS